jgi:3-phosphoshikimate 1-carboxyvinyltransferase
VDKSLGWHERIQHNGTLGVVVLSIEPMGLEAAIEWSLPPSKSHMIRWLALAAQAEGDTALNFTGSVGEDVLSMSSSLEHIGARIEKDESKWVVSGVGSRGFRAPEKVLDCGNSATAARFLMTIAAGMGNPVSLDGDQSLRQRDMSALASVLRKLGCEVTSDTLPLTVTGPVVPGSVHLDISASSQPLSALLLASPGYSGVIHIKTSSHSVSRGYSELSYELAGRCGSSNEMSSDGVAIVPWRPITPNEAKIPGELSLLPLAMLLAELHDVKVVLNGGDLELSGAMMELAERTEILDLRDESDIIAPAAALMALGGGGKITGIAHTRGKESDRISSTVSLLNCFGMEAREVDDGIEIIGEQSPVRPKLPVDSQGDHRLAMTAMILASKCGGSVNGAEVCAVSDPDFIDKLMILGD